MTTKKYRVKFEKKYLKDIVSIPKRARDKITQSVHALASNPRPSGCKKLKGTKEPLYRIRCGDYRIIYTVRDGVLLVLVIEAGHRKNVYL
jgi:mRNA interferase RelE/StbE